MVGVMFSPHTWAQEECGGRTHNVWANARRLRSFQVIVVTLRCTLVVYYMVRNGWVVPLSTLTSFHGPPPLLQMLYILITQPPSSLLCVYTLFSLHHCSCYYSPQPALSPCSLSHFVTFSILPLRLFLFPTHLRAWWYTWVLESSDGSTVLVPSGRRAGSVVTSPAQAGDQRIWTSQPHLGQQETGREPIIFSKLW